MSASCKYVPILKTWQADFDALSNLSSGIRSDIQPFFDIPWKNGGKKVNALDDHLRKIADSIYECWGCTERRFYIDTYSILPGVTTKTGEYPQIFMLKCLRDEFFTPLAAIPTTGIDRTDDFNIHLATQIAQDNRGVCVRLLPEDIDQPSISNIKLAAILQTLSVDRSNTTLLLDLRHVDEPAVNKAVQRVDKWIGKLGNITDWKEIIIAATGIPDNYSKYVRNTESLIPRSEVLIWDELQRSYPDIAARSIFADYCITPPKNTEPDKSTRAAMSAYIKYTLERETLFVKGVSFKIRDGKQFFDLARKVTQHPGYRGPDFSSGDWYLSECAAKRVGAGYMQLWIRHGTSHHIVENLARLTA